MTPPQLEMKSANLEHDDFNLTNSHTETVTRVNSEEGNVAICSESDKLLPMYAPTKMVRIF